MTFDELLEQKNIELNSIYKISNNNEIILTDEPELYSFFFQKNSINAIVFCFFCSDDKSDFLTVKTPYKITDENKKEIKENLDDMLSKIDVSASNINQVEEYISKLLEKMISSLETQSIEMPKISSFELAPFVNDKILIFTSILRGTLTDISLLNTVNFANDAQETLLKFLSIIL